MAAWLISFIVAAISISSMEILFWVSFLVFAMLSVYIQRWQEKIIRDIDDIFGDDCPLV